ncbi:MAG: hypothetical protein C4547_14675 [Phycisphaerales bacterium]|nr:MAG: hypothetical protein C4547_14675 [Phycisphaerales bacterium]
MGGPSEWEQPIAGGDPQHGQVRVKVGASNVRTPCRPAGRRLAMVALTGMFVLSVRPQPLQAEQDAGVDPATAEWIEQLGAAEFQRRDEAMRRLVCLGPAALPALRAAAASKPFEAATRARRVTEWIEALLFTGVEVELSFSREHIRWDEPVDLHIRMTNRSAFAAGVPFAPGGEDRSGPDSASEDVRRLGMILDASDYLRVTDPAGEEVDLRVDDISGEAAAERVVDARIGGGPTTRLAPGESLSIRVDAVNKGWARYAFLDRGVYQVDFLYQPPWPDDPLFEPLRTAEAWVVRGRRAALTVSEAAPPAVSRSGRQALLQLQRGDGDWIARLICTDDLPLWVNANFGNGLPFATCRWVATFGPDRYYVPASAAPVSLKDFSVERLRRVAPGETIEMARIPDKDLRVAIAAQGGDVEAASWTLHADYLNLLDRSWQERNEPLLSKQIGVPDVLRKPLPQRMLILNLVSLTVETSKTSNPGIPRP